MQIHNHDWYSKNVNTILSQYAKSRSNRVMLAEYVSDTEKLFVYEVYTKFGIKISCEVPSVKTNKGQEVYLPTVWF